VTRRFLLIAALLAGFAFTAPSAQAGAATDEIVLGNPKAPIVIVEYFSMTCSHCAEFELKTLPQLRKNWIDTGKARFVFREFPLDQVAFRASMLSRCVAAERGPEAYARLVELLMKTQDAWTSAKDPIQALDATVLLSGGLGKEKLGACLQNKPLETYILNGQLEAQKKYGIKSTPTFVIGDKVQPGALPYEQFDKILKGQ
jgi:protein-disulfide isomerase